MSVNREGLVAKLNATCRSALAGAAKTSASQTHYEVDLEHFLLRLSETTDSDVAAIYRHFGIDSSDALRDLTRSLDKAKRGNSRDPVISPRVMRLLSEAWNLASVEYNASQVRSAFLLLALLTTDSLSEFALRSCPELAKISIETLRSDVFSICSRSTEDLSGILDSGKRPAPQPTGDGKVKDGKPQSALDQYTVNLTEAAKTGAIDPVLGRDFEVRQIVDILTRRRQNNPILTGEAGVGKTAVVEGFALRIAKGDVPPALKNVELRSLDLALLQAGAGVRGEFERLPQPLGLNIRNISRRTQRLPGAFRWSR
jgi:type VI secretion system protein VasG